MSEGPRRANQSDPTAERTADQSAQSAGGVGPRPDAPEDLLNRKTPEDLPNRNNEGLYETPQRDESGDEQDQGHRK